MITGSWAVLALSASIFWGLAYTLCGKSIQSGVSATFILAFVAMITLPCYLFALFKSDSLKPNLEIILNNKMLFLILLGQAAAMMIGQYLIYTAILQKNVTYAAILEISYPLFICLFTWILFRDLQMSWNIAIGGLLIFAGSALVFLKSGT